MNKEHNGVTVAVGYGWQKFNEEESNQVDSEKNEVTQSGGIVPSKGYEVLYDRFWKSLKDALTRKAEGIKKSNGVDITVKRLRASHGKLVWGSILENIKNADILVFDISQPPQEMPREECDISSVIKGFNSNVLVEVGVALGMNKRVLLLCPKHLFEEVPSDLKGFLWTLYTGSISKENFSRIFCDERGFQNAFMGMLRDTIKEKSSDI